MKIWLIERTDKCGYDEYEAAVVAASTEQEAREICPHDGKPFGADRESLLALLTWANSSELVGARFIGDAAPGMPAGVILASFNAA